MKLFVRCDIVCDVGEFVGVEDGYEVFEDGGFDEI